MRTRISLLTWLAVASFALTACAGLLQSGNTGGVLEWARAQVEDVVDGDTFKVEYEAGREGLPPTIRTYLYDTPETQNRTDCFGREATDEVKSHLDDNGDHIWLQHRGRLDQYGRLLAFIYVGEARQLDDLLAAHMIGEGSAWLDARHPEEEGFIDALYERQMEVQGNGEEDTLWSSCAADSDDLADHVVINEVEANPDGRDRSEDTREWIELYNPTGTSQDVSGWTIRTGHGQSGREGQIDIPDTTLDPREYLMVESSTQKIDNEDERVELLDTDEEVVDDVRGLTDERDDLRCNVRAPDGHAIDDDQWQPRTCTPGEANGSVRYDRTLDSTEN